MDMVFVFEIMMITIIPAFAKFIAIIMISLVVVIYSITIYSHFY